MIGLIRLGKESEVTLNKDSIIEESNNISGQGGLSGLAEELKVLRSSLIEGGGPEKIKRQHDQGKLTARERLSLLLDADSTWLEIGMLVAYDQYEGQAPGAGVVTGVGTVEGRTVVVVANDATVKAGSWWPETIKKILRAQEVAMRCRICLLYTSPSPRDLSTCRMPSSA